MSKTDFIQQHRDLFRDCDLKKDIPDETIMERVITFGDQQEVQNIHQLRGFSKSKNIFLKLVQHHLINMPVENLNLFCLWYNINHATSQDILSRAKTNDFFYRKI